MAGVLYLTLLVHCSDSTIWLHVLVVWWSHVNDRAIPVFMSVGSELYIYLLHNVSTLNQCRKLSCVTVVCKHFASYQGYLNYRWDLIRRLTLSLLMSYIYGAPCKVRNFNVIYIHMYLRLATLRAISFYLLHNVSTLNQCGKLSCCTVVCKHFASYQDYPNYRWDLIRRLMLSLLMSYINIWSSL
jgi:hypothetical protein